MAFVSKAQRRYAIGQYMAHYFGERNHQGVDNQLLRPLQGMGAPPRRYEGTADSGPA